MSVSSQTKAPPAAVEDSTRGFSWRRQVSRMQSLGLSTTAALLVNRVRATVAGATALETRFDAERQRHQNLRLPHSHRTTLIR
jgi:hypothetical protein